MDRFIFKRKAQDVHKEEMKKVTGGESLILSG
jgi:hypothetical protein